MREKICIKELVTAEDRTNNHTTTSRTNNFIPNQHQHTNTIPRP